MMGRGKITFWVHLVDGPHIIVPGESLAYMRVQNMNSGGATVLTCSCECAFKFL